MRLRRGFILGLVGGGIAALGAYGAHELAMARQRPIVVVRFLAGYFDRGGRFVPTAGRGASNVDRNAVLLFITSGAVDTGPNLGATLPLTLTEQAELTALAPKVREGTATPAEERRFRELGGDERVLFEPGVIPRRQSTDANARVVATGSVSQESVRIVATAGGGETAASGVFFKVHRSGSRRAKVRRFIFHPSYIAATFGRPGEIDYNAEGFESNTPYTISMNGGPSATNPLTVVTNLDGVPLAEPFSTSFTTTDRYVQDFSRPEIRGTSPTDGAVNVPDNGDVEITFSEPMDAGSFRPPRFQGDATATVRMSYTSASQNGSLAGRNILTQVRVKPQTAGNVIQLRPLQGFGPGPYEVEVTVTAGVTDLSGNNIIRQQSFVFTTENDPTAESFDAITELFESSAQRDTTFFADPANLSGDNNFAEWNSVLNPGLLTTTVGASTFDTRPNPAGGINLWFYGKSTWQSMFTNQDMGGRSRTLTGFSWFPNGGQLRLQYKATQVKIGHANDLVASTGFLSAAQGGTGPSPAHYRETPTTVTVSQNYTIPAAVGGVVAGPPWSRTFNSDGVHNVILEIDHAGNGTGGTTVSSERFEYSSYALNVLTFTAVQNPPLPVAIDARPLYMSVRWSFLAPGAEAQSLWYNVFNPTVRWVPPQIVPFTQPQGTSVAIRWQGARADLNDASILDSSTVTPWTTDIRTLASFPFVRWHVELVNNLTTQKAASIDTLTIPYTYR